MVTKPSAVKTTFGTRGYQQFLIPIYIDRENGISESYLFFSKGKKGALVDYLVGKLLWDELTKLEAEILILLPESTKYPVFSILKSIQSIGKKLTRERFNLHAPKLGLATYTRQQYLSINGQSTFLLKRVKRIYSKSPKYSGYCKGYKDHGSLGTERYYYPEFDVPKIDKEQILDFFLTVEEFPQGYILPDDDSNKNSKQST